MYIRIICSAIKYSVILSLLSVIDVVLGVQMFCCVVGNTLLIVFFVKLQKFHITLRNEWTLNYSGYFYVIQILDAIDEPNNQRLEQPDCCPTDFYKMMLKCWEHDPKNRLTFTEIIRNIAQVCGASIEY